MKYNKFLHLLLAALTVISQIGWSSTALADTKNQASSTSVDGTLQLLHTDDFEHATSTEEFILETGDGQTIPLHFSGQKPTDLIGAKVRVSGISKGQAPTDPKIEQLQARLTVTTKKVAVILFNFSTNPTVKPYTPESAQEVILGAADSDKTLFDENSFGQINLESFYRPDGDVFGWYTIANAPTTCDYNGWANAAEAVASADGYLRTNYAHTMYSFPKTNICPWSGWAYINGDRSWNNGRFDSQVTSHELGHNLGAHHANSYLCSSPTGARMAMSDSCTVEEYGDPFDIMGVDGKNHFNNFHKGELGWLEASNTQDVTTDGTYNIVPIEQSSTGVQSLRIPRDRDINGNVTKYYYLEYRQPFGLDNFSPDSPVVNGVSIRLAPPYATLEQSWLIDTTPDTGPHVSSFGNSNSYLDSALGVGKMYEDQIKNINITTVSVSPTQAVVNISFSSLACQPAKPYVATEGGGHGQPGAGLTMNLTVVNRDSANCPTSTFSVSPSLPDGFTQTPVSPVALAPGQKATVSVALQSDASQAYGTYNLTETVSGNSDPQFSNTVTGEYMVIPVGCDISGPTVEINPVGSYTAGPGETLSYEVKVWNNDTAACQDTTYTVSASKLPAGWSQSPANQTITLAGDTFGTLNIEVTSSPTAIEQYYYFLETAVAIGHTSSDYGWGDFYIVLPACTRTTPTLSSPQIKLSSTTSATYTLTTINRDSSLCPAADFAVTGNLPSGWSQSATPTSLNLAPGQSGTQTVTVTPSLANGSGSYFFDEITTNASSLQTATTTPLYIKNFSMSGVTATNITGNSATINWSTNTNSDSQVEYGFGTNYGFQTTLNPALVSSHSQALSGLAYGTVYHYRVKSRDSSGVLITSSDNTFTTLPDQVAPTVLITSPANGFHLPANGNVTINATASDNPGGSGLRNIYIYIDNVQVKICNISPCSYTWQTKKVTAGTHSLRATAVDYNGNTASHTISVIK